MKSKLMKSNCTSQSVIKKVSDHAGRTMLGIENRLACLY